jgi:CspA family cold shock protein
MNEKKNENEVVSGLVRWFSNERGYGFLQKDGDESVEYFIHFSNIQMEGYKTLKAGQKVTFELINTDKGIQATNVTPA